MEEPKINDVESPKVASQQPAYDDSDRKELSTPSVHSKDGSKDKEAGVYREAPAYTDVEGQESEIHLETAADIVTQVIDLEDDPNINPWTFRMFFLGTAALFADPHRMLLITLLRNGPFVLRSYFVGDLLF